MDAESKLVVKKVHSDLLTKLLELEPMYTRMNLVIKNSTMSDECKKLLQHEMKQIFLHHIEMGEMLYTGGKEIMNSGPTEDG